MPTITTELAAILSTVVRPGDFYASGTAEIYAPGLEVDGAGAIALPLLQAQAAQLIAVAERAPYGRGEETLIDTGVRRVWQIRADQVRFQGRHWVENLETIVARAAEGLGVSDPVEAELYKLLMSERTATPTYWHRPDGGQTELGALPFEDDELSPPDALEEMPPDKQYFHEATGNEGASFSRTYRRAALVLWPEQRRLAVLAQTGLRATLPYLGELIGRWEESGEGAGSTLRQQAHELAGHMLGRWPKQRWNPYEVEPAGDVAAMLALLVRLHDTQSIDAFLTNVSAAGVYGKGDNEAVLMAAGLLPPARTAALIAQIVAANAPRALGACADLLVRAAAKASAGDGAVDLRPAATTFVADLPGDPARATKPEEIWGAEKVNQTVVVDVLTALGSIDTGLADAVTEYMLAWPRTYDLDAVLVPAVLRLIEQPVTGKLPAVHRLRSVCLEHLRARIAQPLEAPRDWTRASTLTCRCRHCTALSQFLADSSQETWTLKAAETDRQHVAGTIHASSSDLDLVTERKGRPYGLVCTKNQASYDRRAKQRTTDLEYLARLEA